MFTIFKLSRTVLLLSFLFIAGCSTSSVYKTFEEQVQETISAMIILMEQENYYDLVNNYVDPEVIKEEGGIEELLRDFTEEDKVRLLKYLKAIQEIQPTVDRKNLLVTYTTQEIPSGLVFKKIGGRWFLTDD
jgi:hypothetical protein